MSDENLVPMSESAHRAFHSRDHAQDGIERPWVQGFNAGWVEAMSSEPRGWSCPNCGGAHGPHVDSCPVTIEYKEAPRPVDLGDLGKCACGRDPKLGRCVMPDCRHPFSGAVAYNGD